MLNYLYITRAAALDAGLTHEGTLFGVPAWFDGDGDYVSMATPKLPILHAWCWLADKCFDLATYFMSADAVLESPISVKRRIPLEA